MPARETGAVLSSVINGFSPLRAWRGNGERAAKATFAESCRFDWVLTTPVHFVHGTADRDVPYVVAKETCDALAALGADPSRTTPTTLEGVDHSGAAVGSLLGFLGSMAQ